MPAETADRQKKKEHGKSNLHAKEDFLQKLKSLNLDPRLKKLLITYEEVFGALPPPLSCKQLVQMDLKLKPGFEKTRVRRRPIPLHRNRLKKSSARSRNVLMLASLKNIRRETTPITAVPVSWLLNQGRLPYDWLLTMVRSTRNPRTTQGVHGKYPAAYCQMQVEDQNGQTLCSLVGGPNRRSSGAAHFYNP